LVIEPESLVCIEDVFKDITVAAIGSGRIVQPRPDGPRFVYERFELGIQFAFVRPQKVLQLMSALCLELRNGAWTVA
jgi:hypothetical protein